MMKSAHITVASKRYYIVAVLRRGTFQEYGITNAINFNLIIFVLNAFTELSMSVNFHISKFLKKVVKCHITVGVYSMLVQKHHCFSLLS